MSFDWKTLYPFTSHFCDVGGHQLHYLDHGSGLPVVAVHGNPTWSFYYRNLVETLGQRYRVIAPDHIGCGLSDKPQDYNYVLSQHIDNLEHLLINELKLKECILCLHDWGGAIGMGFAARHPEKIKGLIILNTAAFLLPECPLRIRICRTPLLGQFIIRTCNGFARAALYMAACHQERLTDAIRAGYLAPYDNYRNRIANLRFVQDIPFSAKSETGKTVTDIQKRLHLFAEKPILICWGEKDFCFTTNFLNIWTQYFPKAVVHRFSDAGHYVLEDAFERILPLVKDFLKQFDVQNGI